MIIKRQIQKDIESRLFKSKAILIYGPRQSGKTTLTTQIALSFPDKKVMTFNGDEPDVRELFSNVTSSRLKSIFNTSKLIIVDEAQRIPNIGLTLKLIVDQIPEVQLIATGSSAFDLANKLQEPLTGRKFEYRLYPLCFEELKHHYGVFEEKRALEDRLIYGSYPEIVTATGKDRKELLTSLSSSYLYKDILMLGDIKKPDVLDKILSAIALQIGSEVSLSEIAALVGVDRKTVEKYIDLLHKAYVIFPLHSFSRNMRNEIKKSVKIYFYDVGIRNSVIGNFLPLNSRNDVGALWENYLISERLKLLSNTKSDAKQYFWRSVSQQELDYVEVSANTLEAFEFKWQNTSKVKIPLSFLNNYPEAKTDVISYQNYELFLTCDH